MPKLRSALWLAPILLCSAPAAAWDPGEAPTALRVSKVQSALSRAEDRAAQAKVRLQFARQDKAPKWTQRTVWTHLEAGRTWVFAVGLKSGIKNEGLALRAAENRARAELVKHEHGVKTKVIKGKDGSRSVSMSSSGSVPGAVPLDWYRAKDGTTYALVVVAR